MTAEEFECQEKARLLNKYNNGAIYFSIMEEAERIMEKAQCLNETWEEYMTFVKQVRFLIETCGLHEDFDSFLDDHFMMTAQLLEMHLQEESV